MRRIKKGLYILESGAPTNVYLIEGARGYTLVDTGHAHCAGPVAAELEESGFDLRELEQVVLTHWHSDHTGAASRLLERRKVKVVAHPGDIPVISGRSQPEFRNLLGRISGLAVRWRHPSLPVRSVGPIREGKSLRPIPHWQVLDTPGHTPGSISLFQPADRVLLCGDALTNRHGRLALPSSPFTHDMEEARQSAERISRLGVMTLCCGHGPVILSAADRSIDALLAAPWPQPGQAFA